MTFGDYVQTITQDKIVPKIVDTVLGGNVIALRFLSRGKPWSGETLKIPFKYQKNSTSQGAFDGFDTFDTTKVNTRTKMSFSPTGYYQSVTLSGMEVDVNSTEAQILDLVKVEMESAMHDMLDSLGTIFYSYASGKNFQGLQDIVDDGTTVATYGGLNRYTTYTTLQADKTAATGGVLTLDLMADEVDHATVGAQKPSLAVCDETVWSLYETLHQPTVTNNVSSSGYPQVTRFGVAENRAALRGDLGFDALWFRGIPLVKDEKCTSGRLYFLNEDSIQWYGLKSHKYTNINLSTSNYDGSPYEDAPKSFGFCWTGLKEPVNQYAEIGQIILMGQLVGNNPRLNSVLTSITTA